MRQQQLQILRNGIQGAARMGKTYAVVGALILTIIGVLIIYGGVKMLMDKHTMRLDANITQAICRPQAGSTTDEQLCSVVVSYPIKDKIITQNIPRLRNQGLVKIGDVMTIYVNPSKPNDITSMGPSRGFAIALLVIGSLIIFFAILYVSFMLSYKGLAALSAVRKIWNT